MYFYMMYKAIHSLIKDVSMGRSTLSNSCHFIQYFSCIIKFLYYISFGRK
jgi:hypothetical protein